MKLRLLTAVLLAFTSGLGTSGLGTSGLGTCPLAAAPQTPDKLPQALQGA